MNSSEQFYKELTKRIEENAANPKLVRENATAISKKHNLPIDYVCDVLNLKSDVSTVTIETAYAMGEQFNLRLDKYFSALENGAYSKWKYKAEQFKFPLEYKMIQIADDQWIGRISVAELMRLRDSQIINYNENTQRVMKHVVKGNTEYYSISLNRRAIASMEQLFKNGTYISNTITLNMPEDTVFEYDEENSTLVIKKMEHFDITDGYHRYIAMSNLYNMDKNFDYPMELRITNYSENKSRQLIWQEDQKTKMSKVDSNSMNLNSAANKVVQKLNMNPLFDLAGSVNNNGCINSAELAEIIRATYFQASNTTSKQKELKDIIRAESEICTGINAIVAKDNNLVGKNWNRWFLYSAIYNIYIGENPKKLHDESVRMAQKAYDMKMFPGREVKRIDMKRLASMKKGG